MREYQLHKYSSMSYTSNQIITFSENSSRALPDIDEEMKFHIGVSSVQVSNLTQKEFDYFVVNYGDHFESIYFFQNTKVKDLSALSLLKKVKYLLFYNVRGGGLWDMHHNEGLLGIMISEAGRCFMTLNSYNTLPSLKNYFCLVPHLINIL